jgi:hypothetical protein
MRRISRSEGVRFGNAVRIRWRTDDGLVDDIAIDCVAITAMAIYRWTLLKIHSSIALNGFGFHAVLNTLLAL